MRRVPVSGALMLIGLAAPAASVLASAAAPAAAATAAPSHPASLIDSAGRQGSLSAFNANEITMVKNGTTVATPSSLRPDGTSFSMTWDKS